MDADYERGYREVMELLKTHKSILQWYLETYGCYPWDDPNCPPEPSGILCGRIGQKD